MRTGVDTGSDERLRRDGIADFFHRVDEFFMKVGPIHETMQDLAKRLPGAGIAYAVIGGMALGLHGYERLTQDVDILLSRKGHEQFMRNMVGLGYVPAFAGARKRFRNTVTGITIDVLIEGEYPGDGKPKPVRFPDPSGVTVDIGGIQTLPIERIIELKIASGTSADNRLKDLADVQELINLLALPREFAEHLDPSVAPEYERLWDTVRAGRSASGPDEREAQSHDASNVDCVRQALLEAVAEHYAKKAKWAAPSARPKIEALSGALGQWIMRSDEAALQPLADLFEQDVNAARRDLVVSELTRRASMDEDIKSIYRSYIDAGLVR